MHDLDNRQDIIDVREVIARIEELENVEGIEHKIDTLQQDDEATELVSLRELMGDLKGYGGDEQWRGDWYPITLIRGTYFVNAMRELVEDIGEMPNGFPTYLEIDWEASAENLQVDYSSVEFGDVTYWYR